MREVISFSVDGRTREDMYTDAVRTYNKISGESVTALPSHCDVDISASEVLVSNTGASEVILWTMSVTVQRSSW